MCLNFPLRLLQLQKNFIIPAHYAIQTKGYAGIGPPKGGKKIIKKVAAKKEIPVEKDVNKLVNYVCGTNIMNKGEAIKLKPDSEYPDWLWSIPTQKLQISELDPNTKQYWRRVRKMGLVKNNRMKSINKF